MFDNQAAHPHHKMILKDTLRKSNMVVTSVHTNEMLCYVKSDTIQKRSSDSRLWQNCSQKVLRAKKIMLGLDRKTEK